MTHQQFQNWLDALKTAWETKNPEAAANLCDEHVLYYETPFHPPLRGKQEVLAEWNTVPKTQENITFSYEILSVEEHFGLAHWSAKFTKLPSHQKIHLDGIFKVSLSAKGLCMEFHRWWNSED